MIPKDISEQDKDKLSDDLGDQSVSDINRDENTEEKSVEPDKETHSDYKIPNKTDSRISYHLSGMYESWFLDYASYVILERAVPHINDGLKPVQRRILHSMKQLDDGRYNKVANIVGHTMPNFACFHLCRNDEGSHGSKLVK